jgi:hypothetical protein
MTKEDIELKNFADDREKIRDFAEISKDEFLRSYSYIEEEEYDATTEWLKQHGLSAQGQYKKLLWQEYLDYLDSWALYHADVANYGMSPACFNEWKDKTEEDL